METLRASGAVAPQVRSPVTPSTRIASLARPSRQPPTARCIVAQPRKLSLLRATTETAEVETAASPEAPTPAQAPPAAEHNDAAPAAKKQEFVPRSNRGRQGRPARSNKEYKYKLEDLKEGQELEGEVVRLQPFGAFVDVGAPTNGLVHISQLSGDFVSSVGDVVSAGDMVKTRVLSVDLVANRLALSMKPELTEEQKAERAQRFDRRPAEGKSGGGQREKKPEITLKKGDAVKGKVATVMNFGAFIECAEGVQGLLHLEETKLPAGTREPSARDIFTQGQEVECSVLSVDQRARKVALTQFSEEERAAEAELASKGAGTGVLQGATTTLQYALAAAGILKDAFPGGANKADAAKEGAKEEAQVEGESKPEAEPEPLAAAEHAAEEAIENAADAAAAASQAVEEQLSAEPEAEAEVEAPEAEAEAESEAESASELRHAIAPELQPEQAAEPTQDPGSSPAPVEYEPEPAAPQATGNAEEEQPAPTEVLQVPSLDAAADSAPAEAKQEVPKEQPKAAEAKAADSKPAAAGQISAKLVKELREKSGAGMMDCKKALAECNGDLDAASDYLRKKGLLSADKKASRIAADGAVASYIHGGSRLGVLVEVNCETDFVARGDKFKELCADLAMQIAANPDVKYVTVDDIPASLVDKEKAIEMEKEDLQKKPEKLRETIATGRIQKTLKTMSLVDQPFIKDTTKTVEEVVKEAVAAIGEKISVRRFERYVLGEGLEKKTADLAKEVEEQTKAFEAAAAERAAKEKEAAAAELEAKQAEAKPAVQVSAKVVKELRDKSGAGMMDCKKALAECSGDLDAASDYLRKKGLASADKKASRAATDGAIASYIHAGSRLGVLVEVNCETDFVARGDKFKELCQDLAMQIAASPSAVVVAVEDVQSADLEKERAIEMEKEDILSKPEAIRGKIVEGRLAKIAKQKALLEQPFIKDTGKTVSEVIKEAVATIGENIQVRRFARYTLGEGMEKRSDDFAAEVAAQTGQA
ncbi:hypothetical protein WJX72_006188 [[Myrmecia] bisecta]|uniref:Elongation factor Ts, mitochondrial n=1 Tax=[Myrmecia] bisecta TaxID=41462 RepID=A0AAW1R6W1_9CHLO